MEIEFTHNPDVAKGYTWWVCTYHEPETNFNRAIDNHIKYLETTLEEFKTYKKKYGHRQAGMTVAQKMGPYGTGD
jgi:hypothetical protein